MLSRTAIKYLIEKGHIEVDPEPVKIGPNSIDLRLGDSLKMYKPITPRKVTNPALAVTGPHYDHEGRVKVVDPVYGATYYAIDPKAPPPLVDVPKISEGPHAGKWLLVPSQFYIGVTMERTKTIGVVPNIDGRSTCGRLSIEAHKTAGVGDNGFNGRWTLEIECTEPVLVAPGDRLFQVYFEPCWSVEAIQAFLVQRGFLELEDLYGKSGGHHYQDSAEARPAAPLDDE